LNNSSLSFPSLNLREGLEESYKNVVMRKTLLILSGIVILGIGAYMIFMYPKVKSGRERQAFLKSEGGKMMALTDCRLRWVALTRLDTETEEFSANRVDAIKLAEEANQKAMGLVKEEGVLGKQKVLIDKIRAIEKKYSQMTGDPIKLQKTAYEEELGIMKSQEGVEMLTTLTNLIYELRFKIQE
jgi:hypothetical protein